ncbi:MAG TPA: DNA-3-methyladenine glycosylase [Candidatus Omnitrophica bacterium]|nr:DNA-3-methyladenine glycosylase [Candidatus Omnitrophota bacterium]
MLKREFFERSPDIVAPQLLGKVIMMKSEDGRISGKIVETEAYFGEDDPSSRAYKRRNLNFYSRMSGTPGRLLIYMVHNNWLLNIVSHERKDAGAVLIRAVEPLEGIEIMRRNRGKDDIKLLTNGPGKFTKSFAIDKRFDGVDITDKRAPILILHKEEKVVIVSSKRIGVKEDLPANYRFYIKENSYVSKFHLKNKCFLQPVIKPESNLIMNDINNH